MNITRETLSVGVKTPFRLLHLSDTHICEADERDCSRKRLLAQSRRHAFGRTTPQLLQWLHEALDYAKQHDELVIHTGDLIDFVSYQNIDILSRMLRVTDTFFAPGNHEFSQYVGEAFEDVPYKMQSFDTVQAAVPTSLHAASRLYRGVNLVALDNGYYRFDREQHEFLRQEIRKGLPILLLVHNPLHTDELYEMMRHVKNEPCAYLTGTPDDLLATYPEYRRLQQQPDQPTRDVIETIRNEPLVKAVLAGHLHFHYRTNITPDLPQLITGAGFNNLAAEITVC